MYSELPTSPPSLLSCGVGDASNEPDRCCGVVIVSEAPPTESVADSEARRRPRGGGCRAPRVVAPRRRGGLPRWPHPANSSRPGLPEANIRTVAGILSWADSDGGRDYRDRRGTRPGRGLTRRRLSASHLRRPRQGFRVTSQVRVTESPLDSDLSLRIPGRASESQVGLQVTEYHGYRQCRASLSD